MNIAIFLFVMSMTVKILFKIRNNICCISAKNKVTCLLMVFYLSEEIIWKQYIC